MSEDRRGCSERYSLLPCPSCGGDDIERQSAPWVAGINGEIGCYIICADCGCAIGINPTINGKGVFSDFLTEADAIAAWNTRAERTCCMEYNEMASGDELYPTEAYVCSLCGWVTLDGKPVYCPNCGAKVVTE